MSEVTEGVIIGVVSTLITGLIMGGVGMFRDELKACIVGWPERHRQKKFNLAMVGDLRAREWNRRNLTEAQRDKHYQACCEAHDPVGLYHVMWAISPEISIDAPSPIKEEDGLELPAAAVARLNAKIGKDQ